MLVLDTDVLSLIQTGTSPDAERVRERLRTSSARDGVTIVTFEEQMRGRLAQCTRANRAEVYVVAARLLRETLDDYRTRHILNFDDRAATEFKRLKQEKVRIGTMDLRIAAIALANDATLITRNLSDFRKVPGLRVEDWAAG